MITAVDTNILLDLWLGDEKFVESSREALESAAEAGSLVINSVVYAELCAHFSRKIDCDLFLRDADIALQPLADEACFLASRIWLQYRKQGGPRTRILPDFLIGAHAQTQATRLLSRDAGFFRKQFPQLRLVNPEHRS